LRRPDWPQSTGYVNFAAYLLNQADVAVVLGSAFGLSPYFRISYPTSKAELGDALGRIASAGSSAASDHGLLRPMSWSWALAGYTGLSAALHLAKAGTSVVVLGGKAIGFGGAGRNVGLINIGLWMMPDEVLRQLLPDYSERLIDLPTRGRAAPWFIERHDYDIDCELERQGTFHCAVGEAGFGRRKESVWCSRRLRIKRRRLSPSGTVARLKYDHPFRANLASRRGDDAKPAVAEGRLGGV
jgi:hypothetical protein